MPTHYYNEFNPEAAAMLRQMMKDGLIPQGYVDGWKVTATPSGRLYCQLQQSVRPISATDYGLWPTATASDWKRRGPNSKQQGLPEVVRTMSLWATPNTMDNLPPRSKEAMKRQFATTRKGRTAPANLREQVQFTLWPTPRCQDVNNLNNSQAVCEKRAEQGRATHGELIMALYPTPSASDNRDRGSYHDPCIQRRIAKGKEVELSMLVQGIGMTPNGSSAQMEKPGQLTPAFPCWLMGFSTASLSSMRSAMQSYRPLRQNSSKHT